MSKEINHTALSMYILIAIILAGGMFILGYATKPAEVKLEILEKNVSVPFFDESLCPIDSNLTCEPEIIADASLFLNQAIIDLGEDIEDSDLELTCDGYVYNDDEWEVEKVYEWAYNWLNEDEYFISLEARFAFDDDSEERACKETRAYEVFYEEGEDPVIERLS